MSKMHVARRASACTLFGLWIAFGGVAEAAPPVADVARPSLVLPAWLLNVGVVGTGPLTAPRPAGTR